MKKHRHKSWLVATFILGLAIVWWFRADHEPKYAGHRLSFWFKQYYSSGHSGQYGFTRHAEAAFAIKQIGTNAVPYLIKVYFDPAPDSTFDATFRRALTQLGSFVGGSRYVSREEIRTIAGWAIREIKPPADVLMPLLTDALNDSDVMRHRSALWLLGCIGEGAEQGVPHLVKAFKDRDPTTRGIAAQSLRWIGPAARPAAPAMIEALQDPQWSLSVIPVLGHCGAEAKAAIPALESRLASTNATERATAAVALCQIDPSNTQPLNLLHDWLRSTNDTQLRQHILWAIGDAKLPNHTVLSLLKEAIADTDMVVSGIAVSVLAKLSPEFALPMLIDKLNDLNINVRLSAARQLLIIDPKQPAALKAILEFLETGTFSAYRDYAIETLSEASADAKEAIAVLQKITKEDRETSTKRRARLSLERIKRRGAIQQSQTK